MSASDPGDELFNHVPYAKDSDTSRGAAHSMAPHFGKLERLVYEHITAAGPDGATADEIERAHDLGSATVTPRIWSLTRRGLIHDSGGRRPTRSGRKAVVHVEGPEPKAA